MERKKIVPVAPGGFREVYEDRGPGGGRLRPGGLPIYTKARLFERPGGQKVPRRQAH